MMEVSAKNSLLVIDLVPLTAGKGGTGGGIFTYGLHLCKALDELDYHELKIEVWCNSDFDFEFKNIKLRSFKIGNGLFRRILWTHALLPLYCFKFKVNILHKISTEIPFLCPSKLIVTIHDYMNEFYFKEKHLKAFLNSKEKLVARYFIWMSQYALKRAEIVLHPSVSVENDTSYFYGNEYKIKSMVTYEGVEIESVGEIKKKTEENVIRLIYVASFYPHKGHISMLIFFKTLEKYLGAEGYKLTMTFRGHIKDLKYYNSVKKHVLAEKIDGITFVDYRTRVSISEIYGDSHFSCLFSEYEGFGLPLIESQRLGIPTICTNLNVFNELLGNTAIYVDFAKIDEAIPQIIELIKDKNKYSQISLMSKQNAARFEWKQTAVNTFKAYQKINKVVNFQ